MACILYLALRSALNAKKGKDPFKLATTHWKACGEIDFGICVAPVDSSQSAGRILVTNSRGDLEADMRMMVRPCTSGREQMRNSCTWISHDHDMYWMGIDRNLLLGQ